MVRAREAVVVLVVLLVGYSLYGAMALAATSLSSTADPSDVADDPRTDSPAEPATDPIRFQNVSNETGFVYTNDENVKGMMSNAGVYAVDYDRDGWTDLLAVGGSQPTLFRNADGEFRPSNELPTFETTVRAALFFDHDNDGWEDLLLLPVNGTPVFLENERGTFERRPSLFDVEMAVPMGAAAGDVNGDDCLDVFVIQNGNWGDERPAGKGNYEVADGEDNGNSNRLFYGNCSAFTEADTAGIRGDQWSLATSIVDLDDDGAPDIHVTNDFNNDVVYWNRGDGTFERDVLGEHTNRNGMSSEIADVDGDGRLDVFTTNIYLRPEDNQKTNFTGRLRAQGNVLLINRGDRRFEDRAESFGLRRGGWGWAASVVDLNNDGDLDVLHTTMTFMSPAGIASDKEIYAQRVVPYYAYPVVYAGTDGEQNAFERLDPRTAGLEPSDGRGAARLDFDKDGDVDLAIATMPGEPYRLYENRDDTGDAVQIRLDAGESGSTVVGARVHVTVGDETRVHVLNSRTDYLSQDARTLHVGLGSHSEAEARVVWPDGTETRIDDLDAGSRYTVSRSGIEETEPFEDRLATVGRRVRPR